MSGNDSIRHVKEEIDNDDEYFRLMSTPSGRIGRNYDGKFVKILIFRFV